MKLPSLLFAMVLVLVGARPAGAFAGGDECVECCRAGGLSGCRSSLRLYGDGSTAAPEGGGWRILGLWFLECDGSAKFEPGATAVVVRMPVAGELLLAGNPPMAFHCFRQACSLPESACLRREAEDRVRLVDCRDGAPMPASQLTRRGPPPAGSETVVVVVGERPLVVAPAAGAALPDPRDRGGVTPPGPCCGRTGRGLFGQGLPVERAVVTHGGDPVGERSVTARDAPKTPGAPGGSSEIVIEVPASPLQIPCGTGEVLATEARRRDEAGNEAVLRGDLQRAVDEYRAALTLDRCNAYAWADLGAVALQTGQPEEAALALAQAIEIQPRHYAALTNLGLAYESLGQDALAADAFRRALALRPRHGPAEEGLLRVDGR